MYRSSLLAAAGAAALYFQSHPLALVVTSSTAGLDRHEDRCLQTMTGKKKFTIEIIPVVKDLGKQMSSWAKVLQMLTETVSSVQASNSVSADWSSSWEQESVLKAVSRPEDRRRRIISIVKIFKYFPLCMLATGGRLSTERCGRLTVSQPPLDTSQPPSERHGNNQQHKIRSNEKKKQKILNNSVFLSWSLLVFWMRRDWWEFLWIWLLIRCPVIPISRKQKNAE